MDDKLTHIILTDHALRYGLDGKSAYEIAQKYGYEGTEQEYAEGPVIAKDKANKAADSADKAAERAKKSASNADQQAARAKSLADHPPKIVTVDDFKVIDGDPRFDRRFAEFNAAEMADEWIRHTYNNGFSLPDMPQ